MRFPKTAKKKASYPEPKRAKHGDETALPRLPTESHEHPILTRRSGLYRRAGAIQSTDSPISICGFSERCPILLEWRFLAPRPLRMSRDSLTERWGDLASRHNCLSQEADDSSRVCYGWVGVTWKRRCSCSNAFSHSSVTFAASRLANAASVGPWRHWNSVASSHASESGHH